MNFLENLYKEIKEKLEREKNVEITSIFLYGSQNYNLNIEDGKGKSDYDFLAFYKPTLKDLIRGKKVSGTVKFNFGEVKVLNIYSLVKGFRGVGPNLLDVLFTENYRVFSLKEFYEELRKQRDGIIKNNLKDLTRAAYFMTVQNVEKALSENKKNNKTYQGARRTYYLIDRLFKNNFKLENIKFYGKEKAELISLKTENTMTNESIKLESVGMLKKLNNFMLKYQNDEEPKENKVLLEILEKSYR